MTRIVRGALLQATWTGDKESMIQKHEGYAHEAAKQGAQFMLFQELFYGPYFCQVQDPEYYAYTEHIPDGPTTKRMQDLAKQTGMVLVVPMYEEDEQRPGIYYNTAAVIDADGSYLGKYRKTHIPHVKGFWEKFYFRPGNLGYPGLRDRRRQGRRLHLLRPPFPGGRPRPGPERRRDRASSRRRPAAGLSEYLWRIEQVSHAVANGYFVGTINRVGIEAESATTTSTGRATSATRAASSSATVGTSHDEELLVRDMDLDMITEVRQTWQFYRDRRPEAYGDLDPAAGRRPTAAAEARPWSSASRSSPTTRSSGRSRSPARPRRPASPTAGSSTRTSCGAIRIRS